MHEYSFLKRVKLGVEKLKKGMYVAKLDKPWEESSFLFQGFPIDEDRQLEQLRRECSHVYIDFRSQEEYDIFLMNAGVEVEESADEEDTLLVEELPKAIKCYKDTLKANKLLFRQVQMGKTPNLAEINRCVKDCIDSLERNEQALRILINSKSEIHYTEEHAVRVSILALAFGIYLGMTPEQLNVLGTSAMLHDIGKGQIPAKLLNKASKLEPEEIKELKEHPKKSFHILSSIEGISEVVKEVALSHHEREDGKGYPRHIPKERVSRFAKIVSLIDAYDAITSQRPYSRARSATDAFSILNKNMGKKFDPELVKEFVKWMGVMPLGSLVEMVTGELGIVLKQSERYKLKPRVLIITDELKKTGFQKVVCMAKMEVHSNGKPYQIKSVLPNGAHGIKIEHYIDEKSFTVPKWCKSVAIDEDSPFAKFVK